MSAIDFYIRVVQALDEIGAPYMVGCAFAGTAFGIQRATYDVDILVSLRDHDFEILSAKFPLPRYYADPEMMRNSVALGIMFNLIDTQEGVNLIWYRLAENRNMMKLFNVAFGVISPIKMELLSKRGARNQQISSLVNCKPGQEANH